MHQLFSSKEFCCSSAMEWVNTWEDTINLQHPQQRKEFWCMAMTTVGLLSCLVFCSCCVGTQCMQCGSVNQRHPRMTIEQNSVSFMANTSGTIFKIHCISTTATCIWKLRCNNYLFAWAILIETDDYTYRYAQHIITQYTLAHTQICYRLNCIGNIVNNGMQ